MEQIDAMTNSQIDIELAERRGWEIREEDVAGELHLQVFYDGHARGKRTWAKTWTHDNLRDQYYPHPTTDQVANAELREWWLKAHPGDRPSVAYIDSMQIFFATCLSATHSDASLISAEARAILGAMRAEGANQCSTS